MTGALAGSGAQAATLGAGQTMMTWQTTMLSLPGRYVGGSVMYSCLASC